MSLPKSSTDLHWSHWKIKIRFADINLGGGCVGTHIIQVANRNSKPESLTGLRTISMCVLIDSITCKNNPNNVKTTELPNQKCCFSLISTNINWCNCIKSRKSSICTITLQTPCIQLIQNNRKIYMHDKNNPRWNSSLQFRQSAIHCINVYKTK